MEFDTDLLRRNHFCMGRKKGKKYVYGGYADEDMKSKAIELLDEAVK